MSILMKPKVGPSPILMKPMRTRWGGERGKAEGREFRYELICQEEALFVEEV